MSLVLAERAFQFQRCVVEVVERQRIFVPRTYGEVLKKHGHPLAVDKDALKRPMGVRSTAADASPKRHIILAAQKCKWSDEGNVLSRLRGERVGDIDRYEDQVRHALSGDLGFKASDGEEISGAGERPKLSRMPKVSRI